MVEFESSGKEYRISGFVIGVQLIASLLSSALLLLSVCVAAGIPSSEGEPRRSQSTNSVFLAVRLKPCASFDAAITARKE